MTVRTSNTPLVAYAGIAAVVLEWITLLSFFILDFNYAEQLRPISYFATRPATQQMFTLGFTISGLLVLAFVFLWAHKHIKISLILFGLSMACFIAMATIPFRPENIQNLVQHERVTAFFALTYVLGMLHVGIRTTDRGLRHVSFICGTIGLIFGIVTWNTDNAVHTSAIIFYEIICALAAQFWILYLSRFLLQPKKDLS
jgi:hypothetical protein